VRRVAIKGWFGVSAAGQWVIGLPWGEFNAVKQTRQRQDMQSETCVVSVRKKSTAACIPVHVRFRVLMWIPLYQRS
jgi:hypothetical protein